MQYRKVSVNAVVVEARIPPCLAVGSVKWVYRNVYEVIILDGILMKCEECKFCKYDNSIKEFVCSIEPDLPVVARDAKNNCKKAIAVVKDSKKERVHISYG